MNGIAIQNLANTKGGALQNWANSLFFSFSVVFSFHGHLVLIDLNGFKQATKGLTKILFILDHGYIYSLDSL